MIEGSHTTGRVLDQQDPPSMGALAWVGLAARDPEVAVEFYATAFEWKASPEGDHTTLRQAGKDMALVYPQTPQARAANVTSHWSPFFSVRDARLVLERAVQTGGKALRGPFDVPGGRIAAIQDPVGAVFSIWTPRGPDPRPPGLGDAWWLELSTPDVEASCLFYGQLLGWSYDRRPGGATDIRGPGGQIGRMHNVDAVPAWLPCLLVSDIKETRRRAEAAGAGHVGVTEEDAIGRMARIVDPQGASLSLLEPADSE
jgi:predicted enzyme related to lactoylglutathione lyase